MTVNQIPGYFKGAMRDIGWQFTFPFYKFRNNSPYVDRESSLNCRGRLPVSGYREIQVSGYRLLCLMLISWLVPAKAQRRKPKANTVLVGACTFCFSPSAPGRLPFSAFRFRLSAFSFQPVASGSRHSTLCLRFSL